MTTDLPTTNRPDEPGDMERFAALFRQHGRAVYGHIFSLVPYSADADDVFQETCLTLWLKFDQYRPDTDFRAWANRIAYYNVLKLRERQVRSPRLFSSQLLDLISDETIVMSDTLDARTDAMLACRDKLNQRDRSLLDHFHREGATADSVARRVGRNARYVYRAIQRIHGVLFDCIQQAVLKDLDR